ncbi:olfactory receptor 7A5-like [Ictidomys tridecemlineatus]
MEPGNNRRISEFLLLGFSEDPELQPLIFGLFLSMFLVTVLGNLLIILATISHSHPHTPMYFFLSNLSFVDVCFISTTVPKMLVVQLAYSDTFLNDLVRYLITVLLEGGPLAGILYSYSKILSSIRAISSAEGRYKAFSTCASHLSMVSLFHDTSFGVYLSSAAAQSLPSSATASVMYTGIMHMVTPMLNSFIYSLKNKDVKGALLRLSGGKL